MDMHSATTKAYQEKINAELQQVKARLVELEARTKGKMAQAEIDTIHDLKVKKQEIEKKHHELKIVGDAKVQQLKAEIDAEMAKLKSSLDHLATKLKSEAHPKAS